MGTNENAGGARAGRGPLAGVVLAGGLSSRMGRDKALIELAIPGEKPGTQVGRTFALLSSVLPRCWVSCARGRPYEGFPCLFDTKAAHGPAEGIATALKRAVEEGLAGVLALSCDLPCMDARTLRDLVAARDAAPAGTLLTLYVSEATGRLQALTAVYEAGCLPLLEEALRDPKPARLNAIVPACRQLRIPYGPQRERAFFNMNRPCDVAQALDLLAPGRRQ